MKYFSNFFVALVLVIFISSCSEDPFDKYIGMWEKDRSSNIEVFEITKKGDNFFLHTNSLKPQSEVIRLEKAGEYLRFKRFFTVLVFSFSEDGKSLKATAVDGRMNRSRLFKKINNERLGKLKMMEQQKR